MHVGLQVVTEIELSDRRTRRQMHVGTGVTCRVTRNNNRPKPRDITAIITTSPVGMANHKTGAGCRTPDLVTLLWTAVVHAAVPRVLDQIADRASVAIRRENRRIPWESVLRLCSQFVSTQVQLTRLIYVAGQRCNIDAVLTYYLEKWKIASIWQHAYRVISQFNVSNCVQNIAVHNYNRYNTWMQ